MTISPSRTPTVGTVGIRDCNNIVLQVPEAFIIPTRCNIHATPAPSLCQLYVGGRCRQGANCLQAHATSNVIFTLREVKQPSVACCWHHGDGDGRPKSEFAFASKVIWINGVDVPSHFFSPTYGLQKLMDEASKLKEVNITTNASSICRVHAYDVCQFKESCKFLHVCRQVAVQSLKEFVPPLEQTSISIKYDHKKKKPQDFPVNMGAASSLTVPPLLPMQNFLFYTSPTLPNGGVLFPSQMSPVMPHQPFYHTAQSPTPSQQLRASPTSVTLQSEQKLLDAAGLLVAAARNPYQAPFVREVVNRLRLELGENFI